MRTDALPRETVKPYHSPLDSFQRFILNNPKTSLRNRMSDLAMQEPGTNTRIGTISSARGSKRHRNTMPTELGDDLSLQEDDMEADHHSHRTGTNAPKSSRPPRLAPIPPNNMYGPQSSRSEGWEQSRDSERMNENSGYVNDPRDAAGYSELQAAFERAYEKMLREPPPSIVDTVLSSAWKPNAKKSAEWRSSFQRSVHKIRDWDTRCPVYERKNYYDALWDGNCRRVVDNPNFKTMLLRTRPDSQHLLDHRIMDEERQKVGKKKSKEQASSKIKRKKKAEPWHVTMQRLSPKEGVDEG
eukprot:CAMPEP_0181324914 /NCGR_PEP_ID=MMETSP1101-20121128/20631_1 /TAXON_ID=46948 /ORGANISM="Rhodomonas abbreviata, Strain Caron Lab Isolate" /LENGTH=298 /DNA_ID=CAMNT_0023433157 /DNA_START=82 /DNA_END=974 /DNA_ORIENTATION=-